MRDTVVYGTQQAGQLKAAGRWRKPLLHVGVKTKNMLLAKFRKKHEIGKHKKSLFPHASVFLCGVNYKIRQLVPNLWQVQVVS